MSSSPNDAQSTGANDKAPKYWCTLRTGSSMSSPRADAIARWIVFFTFPPFLLFSFHLEAGFFENIRCLRFLPRSRSPLCAAHPLRQPEFASLFTDESGIAVSNELLLTVQTSLVFALLGLAFFEKGSPGTGVEVYDGSWFTRIMANARLLSLNSITQAAAMLISGGVASVSLLNLVRRFGANDPHWETSLLAFLLLAVVYLFVFFKVFLARPDTFYEDKVLRLADVFAALEDLGEPQGGGADKLDPGDHPLACAKW